MMLIGNNKLVFNQATVCRAVEEYINSRIKDDNRICIDSFRYDNNEYVFIFKTVEGKDANSNS